MVNIQNHISKISKKILWLSIFAWSILSASKLKTLPVQEGTESGEIVFDLRKGFDFPGATIRHFKLQKESDVITVTDDGKVLLKKLLDREELCPDVAKCVFTSTIAVLPQDVYEKIVLELVVEDVNDNAPHFAKPLVSVSIPESAGQNARFEVADLRAIDGDIGRNGRVQYQVLPRGFFDVVDDDFRTFLIPKQKLDRESRARMQFTVVARDGGGREAQTKLEVNVEDENDNAPRFTGTRFVATVKEDQPGGTFIYQVEATDLDADDNGLVRYEIVKVEPRLAESFFAIDPVKGFIKTRKPIDRELFDSVVISVEASDNGVPKMRSDCKVTVTVKDQNDHSPVIELTPVYETSYNHEIVTVVDENSEVGTFVAFATFVDADAGDNSRLTVNVLPSNLFDIKKDPEGDYVVRTRTSFDREQKEFYNMTVIACDNGKPKLCTNLTQKIQIGDKNDNNPIMAERRKQVKIAENVPGGTVVTRVTATDADKPERYGKLSYSIAGSNDFAIDEETGVISVVNEIDFERQSNYNLTVTARDEGGRSASSSVEVNVENLNDNNPTINAPEVVYLEADIFPGDVVFSFQVSDADGTVPKVSLEGKDAHKFKIDGNQIFLNANFTKDFSATIVLVTSDAEDEEMKVRHTVKVLAAINYAAVGAGIACGILSIILIILLLMLKFCQAHRYKLTEQFNSLRRVGGSQKRKMMIPDAHDEYSRTDMIISDQSGKLVKSRSTRSTSDGSLDVLQTTVVQKIAGQKRNDSDSGRGESESDTHSRNHQNSIFEKNLGDWCQAECLTLGHSDSCWLPRMPKNHYEVEVTKSEHCQASSLSVWDRTSDYSSHTAGSTSGNDHHFGAKLKSSNAKLLQKTNNIKIPQVKIHSKPCFV